MNNSDIIIINSSSEDEESPKPQLKKRKIESNNDLVNREIEAPIVGPSGYAIKNEKADTIHLDKNNYIEIYDSDQEIDKLFDTELFIEKHIEEIAAQEIQFKLGSNSTDESNIQHSESSTYNENLMRDHPKKETEAKEDDSIKEISSNKNDEKEIVNAFLEKLITSNINIQINNLESKVSTPETQSTETIQPNTNQSQAGKTLDITDNIKNLLAGQYSALIIKKSFHPEDDFLKDLQIIERETEFIITISKNEENQDLKLANNQNCDNDRKTKKTSPFQLTSAQKAQIKVNKRKALRILRKKKIQNRKEKKNKTIKFSTKTKQKKNIPEKLDCAAKNPKHDETNADIIPALVCLGNLSNDPRCKFTIASNQKFLPILIEDFLAAEPKYLKPLLYHHNNIEFKYVNIVGTIVGIYTNVTEKIQLIIEDSTGRVTCVIEPKKNRHKMAINKRLEKWKESRYAPKINKPELLNIMEKTDAQFQETLKSDKKKGADLLQTYGYIIMQKAKRLLIDEYPAKVNLSFTENAIGRHVSITGKAYDWTEERVIYVWDLKFITLDDFFLRVDKLVKEKSIV